jgi:peptidoglycan/xylan/chitin deacetylase (PgdA/CDA1 family)
VLSHDVDEPFRFAFSGVRRLLQRCAGDVLFRKSLPALVGSLTSWAEVKLQRRYNRDPNNTFDLIMDISEAHNVNSAFYFITDQTAGTIDGDYSMDHPVIRQLLRNIHDRGHEIGLHTSYNTYLDPAQTQKEFAILQRACAAEGIYQNTWGGRQHYLRWRTPTTFQNWDIAGLDYDSTLVFADRIGFRCGTCYEFPVFDLGQRVALTLRERPLVMVVPWMRWQPLSAIASALMVCLHCSGIMFQSWNQTNWGCIAKLLAYSPINWANIYVQALRHIL